MFDIKYILNLNNCTSIPVRDPDGKIEGKLEGIELATKERNTAFITYLLQHTDQSAEQIADAVNVPVSFVEDIRSKLV